MLKRNCALTPRGFIFAYCSIVAIAVLVAGFWTAVGVWIVAPFAALDLLAVGVAFLVYARHAADYERVEITAERLIVESADGVQVSRVELNPLWVRIALEDTPRPKIQIRYAGHIILVGTHVPVQRRTLVASEMRKCLIRLA
jgi:uncharacterized membrane protein